MAYRSDYTAGTVSVAANGTVVTGTGTGWRAAQFQEGDWFIANGFVSIIESVGSDTSLTLVSPWQGGALDGANYRLRYMSDGSRLSAQARQMIDLLGAGNVEALAGLVFAADKLIKTTGPGTATLIDLADVIPDRLTANGELYNDWNAVPWEFGRYQINQGAVNGPFEGFGLVLSVPMANVGNLAGFQIASTLTSVESFANLFYRSRNDAGGGYSPWRGLFPVTEGNANGTFIRYPDGTQICTMSRNTAAGAPATFPWAAPFIDTNYVVTAGAISANPATLSSVKISNKTTTTVDLLLTAFDGTNITAPSAGVDVTAIGKWF